MSKHNLIALIVLLMLFLAGTAVIANPPAQTQAMPNAIVLRRSVLGSAGQASSGTNITLQATLGQSSPIGRMDGNNHHLSSGYWHDGSSIIVPDYDEHVYLPIIVKP